MELINSFMVETVNLLALLSFFMIPDVFKTFFKSLYFIFKKEKDGLKMLFSSIIGFSFISFMSWLSFSLHQKNLPENPPVKNLGDLAIELNTAITSFYDVLKMLFFIFIPILLMIIFNKHKKRKVKHDTVKNEK